MIYRDKKSCIPLNFFSVKNLILFSSSTSIVNMIFRYAIYKINECIYLSLDTNKLCYNIIDIRIPIYEILRHWNFHEYVFQYNQ